PARIAAAIHDQLGDVPGAVLVEAVAYALDIVEIRVEVLARVEGALIAPPERGSGSILLKTRSHPQRRRFTLAHELGHYLSPHHVPTAETGFWCDQSDMLSRTSSDQGQHRRQENEANTFAAELLAPPSKTRPFCRSAPDLEKVVAMSDLLDISREAAARRYVEHHPETLAVAISKGAQLSYCSPAATFPPMAVTRGDRLPIFEVARWA
ncbi:ImmA/IrrE family metallo-endopeptidase, partial [uncultured Enterovirga sp.]|uniref:ImmA/IrrE family metallo-endopeptidase n=1 Tax=uncultured Enterovirga sp. TaxID=2026352 RepID=UPI0035C98DBB